ncbi:MAG: hypothetical protein WBG92_06690, partial [Thiohalocapsa sp.]
HPARAKRHLVGDHACQPERQCMRFLIPRRSTLQLRPVAFPRSALPRLRCGELPAREAHDEPAGLDESCLAFRSRRRWLLDRSMLAPVPAHGSEKVLQHAADVLIAGVNKTRVSGREVAGWCWNDEKAARQCPSAYDMVPGVAIALVTALSPFPLQRSGAWGRVSATGKRCRIA